MTAPCWLFTGLLVQAQDKPWRRHTPSSVQARARNHKTPLLSPISGMRVNAAAPVTPDAICVAVRRWQRDLFDGWASNAGRFSGAARRAGQSQSGWEGCSLKRGNGQLQTPIFQGTPCRGRQETGRRLLQSGQSVSRCHRRRGRTSWPLRSCLAWRTSARPWPPAYPQLRPP